MRILGIEKYDGNQAFTHKVLYSEPEVNGENNSYCLCEGATDYDAVVDFLQKRVLRTQHGGQLIFPINISYEE